MKTIFSIRYFALVAAAVGGLFAADAVAANTKTYAGLACVEGDDTTPEIRYAGGNAYNDNSSNNAHFICPFVRPSSSSSGDLTSPNVRVADNHSSQAVKCHIRSCNAYGTDCEVSSVKSSSGTGRQSLGFSSVDTFTNGFAYVFCDVPRKVGSSSRSGVLSYRVTD